MASLDIPSEANDEDADIIFDYSSDENPYENPYTEYNFAQKRKKSYVDEDLQREFDYKPPTQTERYLYQQGKIRTKKNKWEQIPPQYIPKIPITRMDHDILNLDCETDIDEIIQDWNNRLSAQIQLTEELRVLHPRDLLNFIIHRTSGNVYRFIESLDELELSRIATTDAMTTFKNVVARIVQEFTGRIPGVEASNKAFREHAYWRLINLKICNMCYLDPFICEFSDQYYKLDPTRQKTALEMFFNKLPESVSTKIKDMYNGILQDGTRIQDTLGARITTLKAWMRQECLQETAKKEAQVKLCCEMQSDKVGNYGCSQKKYKKRKKVWKRKLYNSKYKQSYKKNSQQNYFRNRKQHRQKYNNQDNSKYCPSKKKNCRCWLCHEVGHYANTCPKKGEKKETEVLKIAYDLGYEPLEDSDIDSDIEIYAYTNSSDYSSDTSSNHE
ncbi:coat protein [Tanacetum coccineum]